MRFPRVLFLLPLCVSLACGGSKPAPVVTPYVVQAQGPSETLELSTTVDIPIVLQQQYRSDEYDDEDEYRDDGPIGCSAPGASSITPSLNVTHATCADGCTATVSASSVSVTAQSAGTKSVVVSYTTSDDATERTLDVLLEFRKATKLDVSPAASSPSGSTFAMIPNDSQTWTIIVSDELGPLKANMCGLHVSADGVLAIPESAACDVITFKALRPGIGTITAVYGDVSRTDTISVIDPKDATSVELHHLGDATVEDPLALHFKCDGADSVVLRFETADGVVAYGGASTLSAPGLTFAATDQTAAASLVDLHDGTIASSLPLTPALHADYTVLTGCDAQVDAGDAGDAGTDGGDQ